MRVASPHPTPPGPAPPPERRETPCVLPPRDSAASPAAAPTPSLSRGRFGRGPTSPASPTPTAAPPALPRSWSPRRGAGSGPGGCLRAPSPPPQGRARRPRPEPGAPQAGRAPPPRRGCPRTQPRRTASRPPPLPQRAPRSPRRRGSGCCDLGPTQAWLPPRAVASRAASWRPRRSRRGRTARGRPPAAPSAAASCDPGRGDNRSAAPGAGSPASVELNRPGRAPGRARCICREPAAHWPAGGGACGARPIEFRPAARRGRPGGAGLLRVTRAGRADGAPPRPPRGGTRLRRESRDRGGGRGEPGPAAAT